MIQYKLVDGLFRKIVLDVDSHMKEVTRKNFNLIQQMFSCVENGVAGTEVFYFYKE